MVRAGSTRPPVLTLASITAWVASVLQATTGRPELAFQSLLSRSRAK